MPSYLLTWNPQRFEWVKMQNAIQEIKLSGYFIHRWSCGNSKKLKKGDKVFLIRLGRKSPRGIVASGIVEREPYEDGNWENKKSDKKSLYIDVRFETILDPCIDDILKMETLKSGVLNEMHWSTQSSGITIKDEVANALELEWGMLLSKDRATNVDNG